MPSVATLLRCRCGSSRQTSRLIGLLHQRACACRSRPARGRAGHPGDFTRRSRLNRSSFSRPRVVHDSPGGRYRSASDPFTSGFHPPIGRMDCSIRGGVLASIAGNLASSPFCCSLPHETVGDWGWLRTDFSALRPMPRSLACPSFEPLPETAKFPLSILPFRVTEAPPSSQVPFSFDSGRRFTFWLFPRGPQHLQSFVVDLLG